MGCICRCQCPLIVGFGDSWIGCGSPDNVMAIRGIFQNRNKGFGVVEANRLGFCERGVHVVGCRDGWNSLQVRRFQSGSMYVGANRSDFDGENTGFFVVFSRGEPE